MLDMNAPYDVAGCIRFAEAVAPYDIFWLEEPLHWYLQPADYRAPRRGVADSAGAWRARVAPLHGARLHRFRRDRLRAVRFHAAAGFTESLRIAHYAEQKGVVIAPHSALHVHAHLVSAFGDAAFGAESRRSHPPSDPSRDPSRWRAHEGRNGASDRSARLRDGNRLGGCREVPISGVVRLASHAASGLRAAAHHRPARRRPRSIASAD